ncbi:hypothetical protein LSAT2_010939 [Lamellibrachia satsuma]|nr:hypothetical protein LSAT2_010939 [Lamellibrachia satsuma]
MPRPLKHAIVRPSLKKPSLDKDILSNYRPVSNLTQLSKVIEKVVALRIMTHVSDQQMVECFQSAYRKKHSTETALLYVTSAIKTAMDNKQGTTLVLVDFSAAFDTINHDILIRRLRLRYGFVGKALDWIISYLQERTQRIVIGGQSSSTTTLTAGVPQGSVLGPLLFSLYVQPIGDIIRAHGLFFHHYADDLQIYSHFDLNPSALAAVVQQMEDCLDDIKQWMAWNSMCMNDGKTQYLPIAPKSAAALVDGSVIRVGVSTITASRCVRNLGVFIDRHLDMKKQVSQTAKEQKQQQKQKRYQAKKLEQKRDLATKLEQKRDLAKRRRASETRKEDGAEVEAEEISGQEARAGKIFGHEAVAAERSGEEAGVDERYVQQAVKEVRPGQEARAEHREQIINGCVQDDETTPLISDRGAEAAAEDILGQEAGAEERPGQEARAEGRSGQEARAEEHREPVINGHGQDTIIISYAQTDETSVSVIEEELKLKMPSSCVHKVVGTGSGRAETHHAVQQDGSHPLDSLSPASEEEARNIIIASAHRSCALDPLQTWLLKNCVDAHVPVITRIVNISIPTGDVSANLKAALVTPLLNSRHCFHMYADDTRLYTTFKISDTRDAICRLEIGDVQVKQSRCIRNFGVMFESGLLDNAITKKMIRKIVATPPDKICKFVLLLAVTHTYKENEECMKVVRFATRDLKYNCNTIRLNLSSDDSTPYPLDLFTGIVHEDLFDLLSTMFRTQYVRIDLKTPVENVVTLLKMDSGLSVPKQIVFLEEEDNFQFKNRQHGNAFKKNLRNELAGTGSWIFKEATNHNGLDTLAELSRKEGVLPVGIASWSSVYQRNKLKPRRSNQQQYNTTYLQGKHTQDNAHALDDRLNYFILVDTEETTLNEFKKRLRQKFFEDEFIPVVQLLLGSGDETVAKTSETSKNNIPVVVMVNDVLQKKIFMEKLSLDLIIASAIRRY